MINKQVVCGFSLFVAMCSFVGVSYAGLPKSIDEEVLTTCKTSEAQKNIFESLPSELAKSRVDIREFENSESAKMVLQSQNAIQKGKWDEKREEEFAKKLIASSQFQSYEQQRSDLVNVYMTLAESVLQSLQIKDSSTICKQSVIWRHVMDEFFDLTKKQYAYMRSEQNNTLPN